MNIPCKTSILPPQEKEQILANTPQAKKRALQGEKRRQHNASLKSMMRTYLKRVNAAILNKDKKVAERAYSVSMPIIDKMADKGLIHKNKAARHKSRLNSKIKAL